jgi:hypothetical protein
MIAKRTLCCQKPLARLSLAPTKVLACRRRNHPDRDPPSAIVGALVGIKLKSSILFVPTQGCLNETGSVWIRRFQDRRVLLKLRKRISTYIKRIQNITKEDIDSKEFTICSIYSFWRLLLGSEGHLFRLQLWSPHSNHCIVTSSDDYISSAICSANSIVVRRY